MRFAVHTIDFDLVPTPAPPAETTAFQVNDRPKAAAILWNERSLAEAEVSLRLSDLTVHHYRTFRDADVRFDTLVITEDATGRPEFHVRTSCYTGIGDGERLTLSEEVLFHGTARNSLHIAMWVSPDGPLDLAASLRTAPSSAASLVDTADAVLRKTLGAATALYRTILLGTDNFGRSDPPRPLTVRAQDFSFRCSVLDHSPSLACSPSE